MARIPSGAPAGRPIKPSALKVLHGDFKVHPERKNANEPAIRGEVVMPDHLTPTAKALWEQLAPMLIKAGVLTPPDVALFGEFCEATVVVRLTRREVMRHLTGQLVLPPGSASPMTSYARAIGVLTNLGGRFGLTPSDRARLIVPDQTGKDDLLSG